MPETACKYCGFVASRLSDEDCPAKPWWKRMRDRFSLWLYNRRLPKNCRVVMRSELGSQWWPLNKKPRKHLHIIFKIYWR